MDNGTVLIAGGLGYIGSHAVKLLNQRGYSTVAYDSLVYGHREFHRWGDFVHGDLSDIEAIRKLFKNYNISAVMHFAAFAYVGESVENPEKYYFNNVVNTLNLLKVMREFGVQYFIFSSTCATYGEPETVPIPEEHRQNPINPYGRSKLMVEQALEDFSSAYGIKYGSLRYFNASGADPDGEIGEWHDPETHLIPLVLDAAIGNRENVKIFGTNYETRDGTCIRDYIHVTDLAEAHLLALEHLKTQDESVVFNLGNGNGFSVREVIDTARKVTGKDIPVVETARRAGDPPELIGSSKKIQKVLGWKPRYNDLSVIIETAWNWHQELQKLKKNL